MSSEISAVPERTDRVGLAVRDAMEIADNFATIFDTEIVDDVTDSLTVSRRLTLQWGRDQVELYEPVGEGPVSDFLEEGRSGLFAGGIALSNPGELAAHIEKMGVRVHDQGDDRYLILPADCRGTGIILSRTEDRPRVGLADSIWQITYAAASVDDMCDFYIDLLNMRSLYTNLYTSELFGYYGGITWFDARDRAPLDSLEYLEPTDPDKAVARFVKRNGSGIYMCAIQTDDIPDIQARVESTGRGWTGAEVGGFIHPSRLGGMLLGLCYFDRYNATRPLPDK